MATTLKVMPKATTTALDEAIVDYLADVDSRGLSPRSREGYEAVLALVLRPWCEAEGIDAPSQLDQKALNRFNVHLLAQRRKDGKPLSPASVNSYLRSVRTFISWAKGEKLIESDVRVKLVKQPKKEIQVLTKDEIDRMEEAAPTERDRLIIRILGTYGLRLDELLRLTTDDLILENKKGYILVNGKGSKQRMVPLRPQVFNRLMKYATKGRPDECYTSRIFISLRKRPSGEFEGLDARAVQKMLPAVAERAGIKKNVHPHLLRHSTITNRLKDGMNMVALQRLVGHADLSMIANTYSHLNHDDLHDEMMRVLRGDD